MQRRGAVPYVVLFVLIAAGSYAVIATAQSPTVEIQQPDYELAQGDSFTVNERQYTVTQISPPEAQVAWTNDSALYTTSFGRDGTVDLENTTYDVVIPNESNPDSAILREQPGDDVETVERSDGTYVVVENQQGNDELVPITEYDPLDRIELTEDEAFDFRGNQSDVNITRDTLTLRWTSSRRTTVALTSGANVTLNGQQFLVFIESEDRLVLTANYQDYAEDIAAQERFHERMNGFWGVVILSGIATVLLIGMAFMPRKET